MTPPVSRHYKSFTFLENNAKFASSTAAQANQDAHHPNGLSNEFRASILRDAFRNSADTQANRFYGSPWSYSILALAGSLTGCSNHPPLIDETSPSSDAGGAPDAARPPRDAGTPDSEAPDAGIDSGTTTSPELCQVKLPMAVMFYDCVDMASEGEEPTRVCLSEEKFGGDLASTRAFIEAGIASLRHLYSAGCSPFGFDPVVFFPDRVLNAQLDSPELEFRVTAFNQNGDPLYNYTHLPFRLRNDIIASGEDPNRFGIYVVLNGWSNSLLLSAAPSTYYLHAQPNPPFAITSLNLNEGTIPDVPTTLKWTLRHEGFHGVQAVALHNEFLRPLHVHDNAPICASGGDSSWLCMTEYDTMGVPMHVEDWETALGTLGVPVACNDPNWLALCSENSAIACGDITCPTLPSFSASCNSQGHCEYHPSSTSEPWQSYNSYIYVPPGSTFNMGTSAEDPGHQSTEGPLVPITFSYGYFIGQYEVPIEAYDACRSAGACFARDTESWNGDGWGMNFSSSRPLHPVNAINRNSAFALCEFLIAGGRLPMRTEWEFAARGPSSFLYPHGDATPTCEAQQSIFNMLGSTAGNGCGSGGTMPINSMANGISPIGAWNMSGNVWEWMGRCWTDDYSTFSGNGLFPTTCPSIWYADLAGGGFNDSALGVRPASRYRAHISLANSNVGVRCAASAFWVYE